MLSRPAAAVNAQRIPVPKGAYPATGSGEGENARMTIDSSHRLRQAKAIHAEGPDGPPLLVLSLTDALLEAQQLKEENQVYWGRATGDMLVLKPGDTVADIGANIGSSARLAARTVGPYGKVYAIEPIPEVYDVLKANSVVYEQHFKSRSPEKRPAAIVPIHAGIVDDIKATTAPFVYYPRCTALSTGKQFHDEEDALNATCALVMTGGGGAPAANMIQNLARGLARLLPKVYKPLHATAFKLLYLTGAREVECPVTTLSKLLDLHNIQEVDLLKINVERAELAVLRSVEQRHWPCIAQVSMQLHDRGGALQEAITLLQDVGKFPSVMVYKEPRFSGCNLVQVYATKAPPK